VFSGIGEIGKNSFSVLTFFFDFISQILLTAWQARRPAASFSSNLVRLLPQILRLGIQFLHRPFFARRSFTSRPSLRTKKDPQAILFWRCQFERCAQDSLILSIGVDLQRFRSRLATSSTAHGGLQSEGRGGQ